MPGLFGGAIGFNPSQGLQSQAPYDPTRPPQGSGWGESQAPQGADPNQPMKQSQNYYTPQAQPGMGLLQGGGADGTNYSLAGQANATPQPGYQMPMHPTDASGNIGGYDPSQSTGRPVNPPGTVNPPVVIDPFPQGYNRPDNGGGANAFPQGRMDGYGRPQYQPPQYNQGGGYNDFMKQGFGGGIKGWTGGY